MDSSEALHQDVITTINAICLSIAPGSSIQVETVSKQSDLQQLPTAANTLSFRLGDRHLQQGPALCGDVRAGQ